MKKKMLASFLILIHSITFSDEIKTEYNFEIIRRMPNNGQIDTIHLSQMQPPMGPMAFTIDNDKIYIPDPYNDRIAIFDLNGNYISEIKNKSKNIFSHFFVNRIEVWNNSLYLILSGRIICFDMDGIIKYSRLCDFKDVYDVYFIENRIYYNTNSSSIKSLNDKGEIIGEEETLTELQNIEGWYKGIFTGTNAEKAIVDFLKYNNIIFINDKLYKYNTKLYMQYFEILNKYINIDTDIHKIYNTTTHANIIGFDEYSNTYWQVEETATGKNWDIYVLSISGKIIAWLENALRKTGIGNVIIHPTGDIYLLSFDAEYIPGTEIGTGTIEARASIISKIVCTWNVKRNLLYLRPSSITASSTLTEPTDRNAYSPVKVFDNKPETGWLEAAGGPGIGEKVAISFDQPVTADKLLVSPGYFDSRYWQDNNRVKRLLISLDNYTQFVDFTDNMTTQEVSLGKARTFSSATFTIVEVYKTSHWDDTAIAEIEFWDAGRKLEIDLSGFEDRLKVVPE